MTISRQAQRSLKRIKDKHVKYSPKHKDQIMNPRRKKILHGMSIAIAEHYEPSRAFEKMEDILTYKAEQLALARKLNQDFIDASRGKSGKKPPRMQFIKSVALQRNRTNPIGHFA